MLESKRPKPFGHIHFRHHVVHFQFRTHARLLISILFLAISGIVGGWTVLETGSFRPLVSEPQVLIPSKAPPKTTARQARLPVPAAGSELARLDMIETRIDGSFAEYAYFQTDVSLGRSANSERSGSKAAYFGPVRPSRAEDVFATVLRASQPARTARLTSLPSAYAESGTTEVRGEPINVSTAIRQDVEPASHVAMMPSSDQSLADVLTGLRVTAPEREELARAFRTTTVHGGDKLDLILTDERGRRHVAMARLQKPGGEDLILGRLEDDSFKTIRDPAVYERLEKEATAGAQDVEHSAETDDSDAFADAAREFPILVDKLRKVRVPGEIVLKVVDLARKNNVDIRNGEDFDDRIHLIFREGAEKRDLMSVSFETAGGERRFYNYRTPDGSVSGFFDSQGRSVAKFLLDKPVPAGRLGDGFAWRIHPILGVRKHHDGVDYAAPLGSPIVAAGDGAIELVSWQPGYGRYVRIRHDQGYFTTYAHIDRAAKGIAVGARVSQGQVIAYVGSTGLSTGPHLYYELRRGDRYYDPTSAKLPAGTILTGSALADFKQYTSHIDGIGRLISSSQKL